MVFEKSSFIEMYSKGNLLWKKKWIKMFYESKCLMNNINMYNTCIQDIETITDHLEWSFLW